MLFVLCTCSPKYTPGITLCMFVNKLALISDYLPISNFTLAWSSIGFDDFLACVLCTRDIFCSALENMMSSNLLPYATASFAITVNRGVPLYCRKHKNITISIIDNHACRGGVCMYANQGIV